MYDTDEEKNESEQPITGEDITDATVNDDTTVQEDEAPAEDYPHVEYGSSYSPDAFQPSAFGYVQQTPAPVYADTANNANNSQRSGSRAGKKAVLITLLAVGGIMLFVIAAIFGAFVSRYIDSIFDGNGQGYVTDDRNETGKPIKPGETGGNQIIGDIEIVEDTSPDDVGTQFTSIVAETEKCVVEINTEKSAYSAYSGKYIVSGAGSGVIISRDTTDDTIYYVVTNNHVIDSAEDITVILNNGVKYSATLVATDAITDVALLSVKTDGKSRLTVATLAGEGFTALDGMDIFVIGNPLGQLGGSVTKGIISKTARYISIDGITMTLMQIDAAVNPGNSGGGLFDMKGNLIGIVNAKYTDETVEGLGFAIPIQTVKYIVRELAVNGYVTGRPGLGVSLSDKNYTTGSVFQQTTVTYPTVTDPNGVTGTYTDNNGNTKTFEFKEGDIITSVGSVKVNSSAALLSQLTNRYKIGGTVKVSVTRLTTQGRTTVTEEFEVVVTLVEYKE